MNWVTCMYGVHSYEIVLLRSFPFLNSESRYLRNKPIFHIQQLKNLLGCFKDLLLARLPLSWIMRHMLVYFLIKSCV
jgi:hypothetical protein